MEAFDVHEGEISEQDDYLTRLQRRQIRWENDNESDPNSQELKECLREQWIYMNHDYMMNNEYLFPWRVDSIRSEPVDWTINVSETEQWEQWNANCTAVCCFPDWHLEDYVQFINEYDEDYEDILSFLSVAMNRTRSVNFSLLLMIFGETSFSILVSRVCNAWTHDFVRPRSHLDLKWPASVRLEREWVVRDVIANYTLLHKHLGAEEFNRLLNFVERNDTRCVTFFDGSYYSSLCLEPPHDQPHGAYYQSICATGVTDVSTGTSTESTAATCWFLMA